jgi:hypothetical protein
MNDTIIDVDKINSEFETFWETVKTNPSFFDNKKTGQTIKVITEDGEEKSIVNRRKGIDAKTGQPIFDNDPSLKSTFRERFFVHKTNKFSDGSTPGEKYKQHASIYIAIFNRYDACINTPVYTISYVYELKKKIQDMKKNALDIKKLVENNF